MRRRGDTRDAPFPRARSGRQQPARASSADASASQAVVAPPTKLGRTGSATSASTTTSMQRMLSSPPSYPSTLWTSPSPAHIRSGFAAGTLLDDDAPAAAAHAAEHATSHAAGSRPAAGEATGPLGGIEPQHDPQSSRSSSGNSMTTSYHVTPAPVPAGQQHYTKIYGGSLTHPLTLAQVLAPSRVPVYRLRHDSPAIATVARIVTGLVPNINGLLAVWPAGLYTHYALQVHLLNLPLMLSAKPLLRQRVALAMHYAARASGEQYSAVQMTCFALRCDIPEHVLRLNVFDSTQSAIVDVALRIAEAPSSLSSTSRSTFAGQLPPDHAEWIVLALCFAGMLSKFAQLTTVEIEETALEYAQVLHSVGWSPGPHRIIPPVDRSQEIADVHSASHVSPNFNLLRTIPAANRIAKRCIEGTPSSWPGISKQLTDIVGFGFPILCKLRRMRPVRAIAAALIAHLGTQGLNPPSIPPVVKWLMGLVYATCVNQTRMICDFLAVVTSGMNRQTSAFATIRAVEDFALWHLDVTRRGADAYSPAVAVLSSTPLSEREKMLLALAKTSAGSASVLAGSVVSGLHRHVSRHEIAEACSWISFLELLHRLYCFYEPNEDSILSQRVPALVMGEEKSLARLAHALPNLNNGMTAAAKLYDCTLTASGLTQEYAANIPGKTVQVATKNLSRGRWWKPRSVLKSGREISLDDPPLPNIFAILDPHRVNISDVFDAYGDCSTRGAHALSLMGSAFNLETILSIWPSAMRTYILLLRTPGRLCTVSTRQNCALAAFFSSRSAKSRYSAMHAALSARLQGISEDLLSAASFSDGQAACISVALKLSSFPGSTMTLEAHDSFADQFCSDDVEKIVLTVAVMGFVQKFADVVLCPLERSALRSIGEFLSAIGWDQGQHSTSYEPEYIPRGVSSKPIPIVSLGNSFRLRDKQIATVPSTWPDVGHFLAQFVGYRFPLLSLLRSPRAVRGIAVCILDNLDVSKCNVAPSTKLLCGFVYAKVAKSNTLLEDLKHCANHLAPHVLGDTFRSVIQFADEETDFHAVSLRLSDTMLRTVGVDLTLADRRALLFAKAISFTPQQASPLVVGGFEKLFSPSAIVEQVAWISLLQTLHRLYSFYVNPKLVRLSAEGFDSVDCMDNRLWESRPMDPELWSNYRRDKSLPRRLFEIGTNTIGRNSWKSKRSPIRRVRTESATLTRVELGFPMLAGSRSSKDPSLRTNGRNLHDVLSGRGVGRSSAISSSVAERHSALDFLETIPSWSNDAPTGDDTPWDGNFTWPDSAVQQFTSGQDAIRSMPDDKTGGRDLRPTREPEYERDEDLPSFSEDDDNFYRFLRDSSEYGHDSSRGHSHGSIDGLAEARRAARLSRQRVLTDYG